MTENAPAIDPRHTMLLVMDYEPAIVSNLPDSDAVLGRMAEALDIARRAGVAVGYVRVGFEDSDYEAVPETNKAFSRMAAPGRMRAGAPETAIHDAVAPHPGDLAVRKTRVGAFSTTDLDRRLRDRDIDTLILAGISTSGVVLSTLRDAADRDYRLYVLEDASADRDPEVHRVLMDKVFPRQAWVISIADLPGLLEAR
jgi:nicotinamidase-related amidase